MVVGDAINPPPADIVVRNHLTSLGFMMTLVSDENVIPADANGKVLVYISTTADSRIVQTAMRDVTTPVLVSECNLYDDMGMTGPTPGIDYGYTDFNQTAVNIVDSGHPLAAGYSGVVSVYAFPNQMRWGIPNGNAAVVGLAVDGTNHPLLFAYETGAPMFGMNAPARRIGFFYSAITGAIYSSQGWALFDAAVYWGIGP